MRVGLFGRGRLASAIASRWSGEVLWQVTREKPPLAGDAAAAIDVAIEASAGAVVDQRVSWAVENRVPLVIASTGWTNRDLAQRVDNRIGVVIAPNLSLTVALVRRLTRILARFCDDDIERDPYLVEHHHNGKRDAPSGTAVMLAETVLGECRRKVDWSRPPLNRPLPPETLSVTSIRAGTTASSHLLGIDAPGETVELRHTARDLSPYAEGALAAARWIQGRRGIYSFDDVARDTLSHLFSET